MGIRCSLHVALDMSHVTSHTSHVIIRMLRLRGFCQKLECNSPTTMNGRYANHHGSLSYPANPMMLNLSYPLNPCCVTVIMALVMMVIMLFARADRAAVALQLRSFFGALYRAVLAAGE
jgi:hypothetical protein